MKYLLCSLLVIMILACSPVEFFDDNDDSSVQISQEKNTATLNWKPSPSPNVTEYLVQIKDGDTVIRTERVIHDPSTKEYALDIPLSQGDYTVSLLEKKGEQAEPEMLRELDPITVVTKAEAPKQAEITNSVVFQEGIKIGWTPPKNTGIDHEGSPATITGYTIYWSKGDSVDTATAHYYEVTSPDIQHHTITGLDKDADYSFVVVAKNSDGVSSVVSTPRTLTTPAVQSTPPQAPTDVQTTTSKQGITVSWKPPSDTGTTNDNQVATISFYTLYWDIGSSVDTSSPFSHELPASNTEYLVTGLQGKTQYSFIILARSNARLSSSPSTIITATSDPASPSSPPRDLAAQTVTENTIDISWSAPEHTGKTEDDQDATITAYIVYWQEGDSVDTSATSYQELPPADTSYTIQNLNGKTDYTFMVIAQNSAGFSSDTSIPQTKTTQSAATAPTAPTEIQISQIDADAMRISWITPSNPGKTDLGNPASLTGYTLYWQEGDSVDVSSTLKKDLATALHHYTITGLRGKSEYAVIVVAQNNVGLSSTPSITETATTLSARQAAAPPTTPTISNQQSDRMTISWSAPDDLGKIDTGDAAELTGYIIYWQEGDSVDVSSPNSKTVTSASSQYTIGSLKGKTTYSFIVVTKNNADLTSAPSAMQTATTFTALAAADAPDELTTSNVQKDSITLSWAAPSNAGKTDTGEDATITGYTLYWNEGDAVDTASAEKKVLTSQQATIDNLKGKTQYAFMVLAQNSASLSSTPSATQTATTLTARLAATAPSGLTTSNVQKDMLTLSWSAPSNAGKTDTGEDATITGYTLYWNEGDTLNTASAEKKVLTSRQATIDNLRGKTQYAFRVLAQNNASLSSTPSATQTATTLTARLAATAPSGITASNVQKNSITLSWSAPSNAGKTDTGEDATITGYTLYWNEGDTLNTASAKKQTLTSRQATIDNLKGKTQYAFRVLAQNSASLTSTPSATQTATTLTARLAATAPSGLTTSNVQKDMLTLSWAAPSNAGKTDDGKDATITGYTLYWNEGKTLNTASAEKKVLTSRQATIDNLKGKTQYAFRVLAQNSASLSSTPSATQTATTLTARLSPTAPSGITASNVQKDMLTLSWPAPSNAGKTDTGEVATITGYTLYWNEGKTVDTASAKKQTLTSRQATIDNLKGKTQYAFRVLAQNNASLSSTPSATQTATTLTARLAATAPSGLTTSNVQKDMLTLSWPAPSNAGKTDTGEDATITGYTLYWNEGDTLNTASAKKQTLTSRQATIDNLKGKTQYAFRVLAQNNASLSSIPSATQTATTLTARLAATAPSGLTTSNVQKDMLTLSWTAPSNAGKTDTGEVATITGYTLYWNEGDTLNTASAKKQTLTSRQATIDNLKGKTQYAFRVLAQNSASLTSTPSATQTATTLTARLAATAPSELTTSNVQKDMLTLSWSAPSNAGKTDTGEDATITGYTLYWNEGDTVNTASAKKKVLTSQQATVDNLRGKTQYGFMVLAQNSASLTSTPSATQTAITLTAAIPPLEPTNFVASDIEADKITLSWAAPSNAGKTDTGDNASLARYTVYWKEGDSVDVSSPNSKDITAGTRQFIVTGLQGKTQYSFMVVAKNNAELVSNPNPTTTETTAIPIVLIDTWQKLQNMNNDLAAHYRLASDITFPDPNTGGFPAVGFTPIGSLEQPFTGVLYGNGKKITNLYINKTDVSYIALFGVIDAPDKDIEVVTDLTFVNPYIIANHMAGTLGGYLKTGTVRNIIATSNNTSKGVITTDKKTIGANEGGGVNYKDASYTGGIFGSVGKNGTLHNSSTTITIEGYKAVGGLAGYSLGNITGYTTGTINAEYYHAGGLVGNQGETATTAGYSTGSVTASITAGGLVAYNLSGTVIGYSSAKVTADYYAAGLVGSSKGGVIRGYSTGTIVANIFCASGLSAVITNGVEVIGYSTGTIKSNTFVGGIASISIQANVRAYTTAIIEGEDKLGGHTAEIRSGESPTVFFEGYALGYIKHTSSTGENIGAGIGLSDSGDFVYVGRTASEQKAETTEAGTGDHISDGTATSTVKFTAITEGTDSKEASSFQNFSFGNNDWEWRENYATDWPILNIPDKISGTDYSFTAGHTQNPKITKPSWFTE